MSHSKPLPFSGTSPWSQGISPSLPGARLAFWSRGLGQHSRTASTLDKHPVDYIVYSRSRVFHGGTQTLRRKNPTQLESNPRLSHPEGNSGTPTPPGRDGHIPNKFANGCALTQTLVHLESSAAPELVGIRPKKCYPYRSIPHKGNRRTNGKQKPSREDVRRGTHDLTCRSHGLSLIHI